MHRDIKPDNILLDRQGRVKVADFGLAKLVEPAREPFAQESTATAATGLTQAGKVMGTPQYMAPEQREHPSEVDHRADIYSLGVVFYQMLTGELPGQRIEAPSSRARGIQIDVRLDDVVLRALETEPRRRYQQASEVKTAVETITGASPVEPSPRSHPEAEPRRLRTARLGGVMAALSSHKRMLGALAIAGVLCLVSARYLQSPAPDRWAYGKSYLIDGATKLPLFAVEVGGVGHLPTIAYIVRFADPSKAPENVLDVSECVADQLDGRMRVMDRWRSECVLFVGRWVGEKIRIPLATATARQWFARPGDAIGNATNSQKFWDEFVSPRIAEFDRTANVPAGDIFDEISKSGLADRNGFRALDVLKGQVTKTRRELPSDLTKEFDQCLAAELKTIQASASQSITTKYKRAMVAKRILELSERVMMLPYRKIAKDAQQRKKAQEEYAAALERFEKAVPDRIQHLDALGGNTISGALRPVLTSVQQDIFRFGYGQPLSDQEKVELNRIVDGILQSAGGLSQALNAGGTAASGFSEAAKVANNGRGAVFKFLSDREPGLGGGLSFSIAIRVFHSKIAALEKAVDRDLEIADPVESALMMERIRHLGEEGRRENDPKTIEARRAAPAAEGERE